MHTQNPSEPRPTAWRRHVQNWRATEQSQSAYCKVSIPPPPNYFCSFKTLLVKGSQQKRDDVSYSAPSEGLARTKSRLKV